MSHRPRCSPLFDAVISHSHDVWGDLERPASVTIQSANGLRVTVEIPRAYQPDELGLPRISEPEAFAEVLACIVQVGRRMTRQQIVADLAKSGRERVDSQVGRALQQLMALGILNNQQESGQRKGYGFHSWDESNPIRHADEETAPRPHPQRNGTR
jgi:hypothetical protein